MIELSKAEFAVMEALWQGHPAKASEVVARLSDDTQWHEKTIKTLLGRLVKKQAVSFEKQGRLYSYTPTIGREEYTLKQSKSLIQRFFSGRIAPLVSGFAKTEQLSQQDINELKAVIKEWEDQQGK
ncbi:MULTISPECIES: BlaI/MecI/CopY family transcriptional regulator [Pseudoalteromonas]|uniref:BlaI/MecI/CopY family transcriptional regulator n=1 Tax=Pseudoalteromonas ruthenica TaxID=151081 RepID=A0A0F4PQH3_9GAMM|nr:MULTISPECIES: BlaI/MecI/CopY family transcriptional regulator [Pseudoalteromonas]KJY97303.1 CopY family transcriptional repressor [Pseudoalteromonas ruthenica]KJY99251.1 CopY family transcriptional repressor [Pseudoalteromonas ruthenica]MCF2863652.1 BlaI/MecI/CopY family transcriptional regulator [Pseudoalteromonas sp. CNAT2-18]MCG7543892.1 BlaI/MecI/CopY family transcriptional regulator [Pseudoalteromonas sp. MM17-2]MCG7559598.1 BlaI/MecI/CopY family transcriptional regulator [Pseudoaltero|tara:strand:- start:2512 stop:2889 length:378 start_codon:yes stop_codon:yes gene_type:complete